MIHQERERQFIYGGYARKSSDSEDRQVQSIDTQIENIQTMVERDRLTLFGLPFKESQSAHSIGRSEFDTLVNRTREGTINAWLCYHANRLSRNPTDSGVIIDLMDKGLLHHVRTLTHTYRNNPTDKMMLQLEFMMAKKDSDDKSGFVKGGLDRRYKKGYPNGKAPLGFLNDKTKEKGNRDWLVDTERFAKVKNILKRFLKGEDSIYTLTKYARNELHLTTVKSKRIGGSLISNSGMERLLKNPIYAGFFFSKDEYDTTRTRRELNKTVPRIITEREHLKILSILQVRSKPKIKSHQATFLGFLYGAEGNFIGADHKFQLICDCKKKFAYRSKTHCPSCEREISKLNHPKYLSYTYYYNVQRTKQRKPAKRIEEKKVAAFINKYFREHIAMSGDILGWCELYMNELKIQCIEERRIQIEASNTKREELKSRIQRLKDMYLDGLLSKGDYLKDYDDLQKQIGILDITSEDNEAENKEFLELLGKTLEVNDTLENGSYLEKRALLRLFGSNLVWNEKKLSLVKPIWLVKLEKVRETMIAKYGGLEPEKDVVNKGLKGYLDPLCPTLLSQVRNVRTLHREFKNLLNSKSQDAYRKSHLLKFDIELE